MAARLDFALVAAAARKPEVGASGEELWRNSHIASQMLLAHLDPHSDAASRKPETIDRTVSWLSQALDLKPGAAILDLGCGPGLYCTRFARLDLSVTGIDFSQSSIRYAEEDACKQGLSIRYVCQDYLTMDYHALFDAAVIIYHDFGVLQPADRQNLLRRINRALKPGGTLALDVPTFKHRSGSESSTWYYREGSGFWSPTSHLVLERTYHYPEQACWLDQYAVMTPDGRVSMYRVWQYYFTAQSITDELGRVGFSVVETTTDLTGTPYHAGSPSLGVISVKK